MGRRLKELEQPGRLTLKPASLAMRKQSPTAATVWPRFVSRATSSYVLCSPISKLQRQVVQCLVTGEPITQPAKLAGRPIEGRTLQRRRRWAVRKGLQIFLKHKNPETCFNRPAARQKQSALCVGGGGSQRRV